MVIRTLHWTVPHYWVWGLPFYLFYSTRSSQFLHERPNQGLLRTILCSALSPMKSTVSKFIESYLLWKLPFEKYGLKPDHPFEEDYASCQMAILPENFFTEVVFFGRGTIHPLIPNMAFVGYVESVSNLHTAEIRCKWLARLVENQFKLPSVDKMLEQTSKEIEVMKKTTRFYKRHCISTFSINHSDEICEEMGWKSWRKNNWVSEAFSPYCSQDYEEEK